METQVKVTISALVGVPHFNGFSGKKKIKQVTVRQYSQNDGH